MTRPWRALELAALATVPVNTGVFALRNVGGGAISVHLAGGRSPMGLRGELESAWLARSGEAMEFTYVSTTNYFTLYRERSECPERFDSTNPFVRRDGHTVAQRGPA